MTSLPENPYASPALVAEQVVEDEHLFNQRFRSRAGRRSAVWQLSSLVLVPLAMAGAGCAIGAYQGAGAWIWSGVTVAVTCWSFYFAAQRLTLVGYASLRTQLHDRLLAEGIQLQNLDVMFIEFSPAGRPRMYDNYTNWDVGFLVFFPEAIVYFGDHARFALPLARLEAIKAAPGFDPLRPKSNFVAWRNSPDGMLNAFAVDVGVGTSLKEVKQANDQLVEKLRAWQTGNLAPRGSAARWQHLPLPPTEAEGGKLFREAANPLAYVISVAIIASAPAWLSTIIAMLMDVLTPDNLLALVFGGAGGCVIMLLRVMICGVAADFRRYPFETPAREV